MSGGVTSAGRQIWAVLPAKAFDLGKTRLSAGHDPAFRRQLARLMLQDVLDALTVARGLAGVLVVTDDPEVAVIAARERVEIFPFPNRGHTACVMAAAAELARRGHGMLTLPADIPAVTPAEIETLLAAAPSVPGMIIVPAHDAYGSNAILSVPADIIPLAFGDDSFTRHMRIARAHGIEPQVLDCPGIQRDIDQPDDLLHFVRQPSATRTWRFLHAHGIGVAGGALLHP